MVRGSCEDPQPQLLGFDAGRSTAVPRHREIGFRLVRKICADLEIPAPSGARRASGVGKSVGKSYGETGGFGRS